MNALLEHQQALQNEAAAVLDDLALLPLLREIGRPIQVGSVALGLMVARDIDLTILCPVLDATRVFDAIDPTARGTSAGRELRFRNDTGLWNVDPTTPTGSTEARATGARRATTGSSTSGSSRKRAGSSTSTTSSRYRRG